jgi:hypothetical protein
MALNLCTICLNLANSTHLTGWFEALTTPPFQDKNFCKFCATGERGIDHEGVQSIKTAERLGLLDTEVQAFLCRQNDAG